MSDLLKRLVDALERELDEHGYEDDDEKRGQVAHHFADVLLSELGLTPEHRTGQDGFGGVSSRYDAAGRIISTTTSGRSPTEMRRYVTVWEVSREPVEHSYTRTSRQ